MASDDTITAVVTRLFPLYKDERERLDKIDDYLRGKHPGPYQPRSVSQEYRLLIRRATSNWLPLVIDAVAQQLYVEGFRTETTAGDQPGWDAWQANGMDSRQSAIHRAALAYGHAYATVLPGDTAAVIRGVSPRSMFAAYDDPAEDEWPRYALRVTPVTIKGTKSLALRLFDEENVYELVADVSGTNPVLVSTKAHDQGVCPVIRYSNLIDLEGRACGEIEPLIPIQDRINQTLFDLLIAQTFSSFKVRTVAGMVPPMVTDDEGNPVLDGNGEPQYKPVTVDAKRWQFAEDADTKFGQLDETPLKPFIDSVDLSVNHLAAISQTPPHYFLGEMANLSAEALDAADMSLTRKVTERRHSLGESHEQTLRLAAQTGGSDAVDDAAQVVWRDTRSRSFQETMQGLGTGVTSLQIPPKGLWPRVPDVTQQDLADWERLDGEAETQRMLTEALSRAQAPSAG